MKLNYTLLNVCCSTITRAAEINAQGGTFDIFLLQVTSAEPGSRSPRLADTRQVAKQPVCSRGRLPAAERGTGPNSSATEQDRAGETVGLAFSASDGNGRLAFDDKHGQTLFGGRTSGSSLPQPYR